MSKEKRALVAIAKESEIQASVTKVFDLMGGVTNMIEKGSTVVLKPNAGHAAPAESAVCTNPETLRAVIHEVRKAQPRSIVVAESAAVGCDTMECYQLSGIAKVCEEENVEMIDTRRIRILLMWLSEAINLILSMLRSRDFSWRQITSSICRF